MGPRNDGDFQAAHLHTPDQLLAGAKALLLSSDPQMMRVVVLEAMTALEAFVHSTIFSILEEKLDLLLVEWLEKKTRMDFDTRLGVLTPVALGQSVDKKSVLWNNYKKAREIRNKVTHLGCKVSLSKAKFVVKTVHDWLAFLGSTAEVELALLGLKKYIERTGIKIEREQDAIKIVLRYFSEAEAASGILEAKLPGDGRADLILRFGENKVLVETKFTRGDIIQFRSKLEDGVAQTLEMLRVVGISRAAIVAFHKGELPESYELVKTSEDGKISIVGIRIT